MATTSAAEAASSAWAVELTVGLASRAAAGAAAAKEVVASTKEVA